MADISKIQIGSGTYNVKDEQARNDLASYESSNNTEIANLKLPRNFFTNKKFILIGDSYADGYTPDGNVTSWEQLFVNYTGLTNTIQKHKGGTGFVNLADNKNFQTLLEEVTSDNTVTDIVVLGGYNDISYNGTQIKNAISSFVIKANEKFPNANIHIGFVGWCRNSITIYPLTSACQYYKEGCGLYMASYLNNMEFTLHDYFNDYSSDGIHPNANGQTKIARNLIQALMTGCCTNPTPMREIHLNYNSNISGDPFGSDLRTKQDNNIVSVSLSSQKTINFSTPFNGSNGLTTIEIGTITSGHIIGSEYNLTRVPVQMFVHDANGFWPVTGNIVFLENKIKIQIGDIRDDHNGYRIFTNISGILISGFSATFDALWV